MATYKMKNLVAVIILLGAIFVATEANQLPPCDFPAIFNFGDSNSDTGDSLAPRPGPAFTGKPNRPECDGRLIIDFIAEKLGKLYLNSAMPVLGRIVKPETNFTYGANFAVGGSTIRHLNVSRYPILANETGEFTLFKARAVRLPIGGKLPRPQHFPKALYTIDIGENDLILSMFGGNVKEIPDMIQHFAAGVKKLYDEGARTFWIHNTGPLGCLSPYGLTPPPYMRDLDELGCLKKYNQVALEFNKQLEDVIVDLRADLKEAAITYVDVYTAKHKLFSDAKNLGFANSSGYCFKDNTICADPSKYILWDGMHYTEAANRLVAKSILDGSLSDPPLPITYSCYQFVM